MTNLTVSNGGAVNRFSRELVTFKRPVRDNVEAPAVGSSPPPTSLFVKKDLPVVIAFLRHCGCPFAELTMQGLRPLADAHPEMTCIAVSHSAEPATSAWLAQIGGPGKVKIHCDPERREYRAWGVGISNLAHFMGTSALLSVIELLPKGIRNREPDGTRWQMAGTFAVDRRGIVQFVHLPAHAGDLPDFAKVAESLK